MDRLSDDELCLILARVAEGRDRKSCSEVSSRWAAAEGRTRTSLRALDPALLPSLLPRRFPNLLSFSSSSTPLPSPLLSLLASSCPRLRTLNLSLSRNDQLQQPDHSDPRPDFCDGDLGVVAAAACPDLRKVCLRRRANVGDSDCLALAGLARNLAFLDISRCCKVSDEALRAIGAMRRLDSLFLRGCWLVTDAGLAALADGAVSGTLRRLDLSECDQISDAGLLSLGLIKCLQELGLADCGPKVTDIGGEALASTGGLRRLDVSWLINLSDATMFALARRCGNLQQLDVTGCELITGVGVRAFSGHGALESLALRSCGNVTASDVVQLVAQCLALRYLALDISLRGWMASSLREQLAETCTIDWL